MVAENKIDLNGTINQYLGKYTSEKWEKVTIHHLLSHSSGIPSLLQSGQGLDHVFPKEEAVTLERLISYFKDLKLKHKPGKKYRYNKEKQLPTSSIAFPIENGWLLDGFSYGEPDAVLISKEEKALEFKLLFP